MTNVTSVTSVGNSSIDLDITTYPNGLYIVNIVTENGNNIRTTFEKTR
jgi:hypothetical protein